MEKMRRGSRSRTEAQDKGWRGAVGRGSRSSTETQDKGWRGGGEVQVVAQRHKTRDGEEEEGFKE